MPHIAATSAASSMSANTVRFARTPWLALLLLCCLASLCINAVQGRALVPRAEHQTVSDYLQAREQRRRVECRRACWTQFVPENADCLKDTICYQCYLNCASPLISPTTTTTTTSTTTTVPTTMSIMERQKQQQQQQLQQTQQTSKINKPIQETWTLHTVSMLQQDSLVLVDIAWDALNTPNQCLISWEVSGGGLMGNLLTESSTVQLSLWPDTKYRVKVTCKNKLTGFMSRSLPLSIDTSEAVNAHDHTGQHKTQSPNAEVTSVSTTTVGSKIFTPYRHEQQQHEQFRSQQHIPNNALEHINGGSNDEDTDISSHSNGYLADVDNAAVLPYDEHDNEEDQSAEALNKHTKFIFNWHSENSDISLIEPIHKPELNMLHLAIDDVQKPFLFGLTAGTVMLGLVALALRCMLRRRRLALEKTMLITDDTIHAVVSVAPAEVAMRYANNKAAARKAMEGGKHGCGGGGGAGAAVGTLGATSLAYQRNSDEEEEDCERQRERGVEEVCSNPAICSRNALKV